MEPFACRFDASAQTIRSDPADLVRTGMIEKIHGSVGSRRAALDISLSRRIPRGDPADRRIGAGLARMLLPCSTWAAGAARDRSRAVLDASRDCNSVAEAPMSQWNAALAVCLLGRPGPLAGKSPARLTDAREATGVRAA